MPKVVHFEITSNYPDASVQFYQNVFGWRAQEVAGTGYWFVTAGDDSEPGLNGAITQKMDPSIGTVVGIQVRSIDDVVAKIAENGGYLLIPKTAIPGMGNMAYCMDPEGNAFSVLEPEASASTPASPAPAPSTPSSPSTPRSPQAPRPGGGGIRG